MNYSQPQQQQSNYRPNRAALWVNQYKNASNQPDYRGNVEISYALFQELSAAFNSGQYEMDRGNQPCIKLDLAIYAQQGGDRAPVMSGTISTLVQTQQRAAARAARQQQETQGFGGQPPALAPQQQYGQPPAPQPPAPMPQQQQAPQPPVPNWLPPEFAQQQYAPQQEPGIAAPMPQQQPPQQAYQQPPQPQAPAPLAPPPAGVQPMPGAIHAPQPPIMPPAVAAL